MRIARLREYLRSSLWFIPSLCVIAAIALAFGSAQLDFALAEDMPGLVFLEVGAASARTFLSALSSSMISLTALVFSITIVVLQLASSQFSPRVLRTFFRDRRTQFSLGVFVATFTYSMLVLREVGDGQVPQISISIAFLLALLSIAVFVSYIHHVADSIRVSSIVQAIASEARSLIRTIYDHDASMDPPVAAPEGVPRAIIRAPRPGVVSVVDRDGLVEAAARAGCIFKLLPQVGQFVAYGAPLLEVHGTGEPDVPRVLEYVELSRDRTMQQDVAFGFRQLVDIAERSLSPAVNDPTTAVEALDQIHDLLRRIAARPFPSGQRLDSAGALRLVYPVVAWEDYVHLAVDEIRVYGHMSIQVMRRLREMLEDLATVAVGERRDILVQELREVDLAVEEAFTRAHDRERTRARPERSGV